MRLSLALTPGPALYRAIYTMRKKWEWEDLNLRPMPYQGIALTRLCHIPEEKRPTRDSNPPVYAVTARCYDHLSL